MAAEKASLQEGLGRLREEGWLEESGHPDFDSLLALQAGDVTGREAEALARHLDSCLICRQVMADWAQFPDLEPPAGSPSLEEDRADEDWRKLRDRMVKEGLLGDGARRKTATEIQPHRAPFWPRKAPWMIAASFAMLSVGLGFREVKWQRETATLAAKLEAAQQGRLEKNFLVLEWRDVRHGVPRGATATSLVALRIPVPANVNRDLYASYELEVHDAQGRLIRHFTDLIRDPALTLSIDRSFLNLEKYRFSLYGVRRVSGERQELPLPDQ